jgi:pimeloyl-ACP methyl ester carboxylesterase
MKRFWKVVLGLAVLSPLLLTLSSSKAYAIGDETIVSRTAEISGVKLHYLTSGHGTPLILLHGYAETSRMWRSIIPALAERFTVIAPDLPGIGDSDIPADGLDMKSAAIRIHDLAKSLRVQKAEVVGHDIGLMVAYAYAAQFPGEVTKLVLMDAFLPGVSGWEAVYNDPAIWHFRFNGPTPEALVQGRERTYFDYFWNDSQPTKLIRFRKRIARPTRRLTPGRDACMRDGPISFHSCKPPRISRNSLGLS